IGFRRYDFGRYDFRLSATELILLAQVSRPVSFFSWRCTMHWLALVVLVFFAPVACAAEPSLESRIAPLAKEHKGKVAVAVKNLKTGEEYYLNADEVMGTASLIKLPVMVEAYWQVSEGKTKLETMVTLKKEDKVPGSGILTQHFSEGATFPLRDA